jgi:transcriptional regulator with XRE-family HTH domain
MKNDVKLQKDIGKRLAEIRADKMKMSKEEFAPLIGMLKSYLGLVEKGERGLSVDRVVEICNKTDTSADFLLRGIDDSMLEFAKDNLEEFTTEDIEKAFKVLNALVLLLKHI